MNEAIRVRERPILFSAAMVAAILEGRKTQTRRVIKPQPQLTSVRLGLGEWTKVWTYDPGPKVNTLIPIGNPEMIQHCPHGYIGEHLWVREAWQTVVGLDKFSPAQIADQCLEAGYEQIWCPVQYADGTRNHHWIEGEEPGRKRNALHMPRWASRITLEITGIRVERIQDISEQDALQEGVWTRELLNTQMNLNHIGAFRMIWDSLHPTFPFHWNANPWVWVIEFRRIA